MLRILVVMLNPLLPAILFKENMSWEPWILNSLYKSQFPQAFGKSILSYGLMYF